MTSATVSPLAMLVRQGLEALTRCSLEAGAAAPEVSPSATIEQLAGGLLVAMGYREIADDLDLEAIALLGTATVAGLQAIALVEPGLHRVEDALWALEDLLRRTAPGGE